MKIRKKLLQKMFCRFFDIYIVFITKTHKASTMFKNVPVMNADIELKGPKHSGFKIIQYKKLQKPNKDNLLSNYK